MSEKYFEYIVGVLIVLLPVLGWHCRVRLKYLQNLARINILKRQQKMNENTFFATDVINHCVQLLYFDFSENAKSVLTALIAGRVEKAVEILAIKYPKLALLLSAHTKPHLAYKQISRQKRIWCSEPQYGVYLPILAYSAYDRKTVITAVNKLSKFFAKNRKNATGAYYNYISAYTYLYEGEMLSASQKASDALKFFQKKQYAVETAACHLLLAEIYRISCVNDIAETMIDSAIKIYQSQKAHLLTAKAVTVKGMLMVFENRFEEAEALYEKALEMPITEQLRADIYNQQALLLLISGKIRAAEKLSDTAVKMQENLHNKHGLAFALQLAAQAAFSQKKYTKTMQLSRRAGGMYEQQQNYSAQAECLYLTAEARCKQNSYGEAEKSLRAILTLNRRHPNSFHSANAYSLLGLIYMQRQDLQRAKVLFQQSLHLEQSKQRCEGMVADYANLALIEELTDNPENAASNREIALEYAKQTEDEELIALIEKAKKF